jgi:hypothetical protein
MLIRRHASIGQALYWLVHFKMPGRMQRLQRRKLASSPASFRRSVRNGEKKQAERAFADAAEIAVVALQLFDLSQPRLPIIPFVSKIKSHSQKGKVYEVNLAATTCTCPDWRNFRHRHPEQHLTCCCKHVFDAYNQFEPPTKWPGWLRAFFELASPPHPKQQWAVLNVDQDLVLVSSAPNGWANVFASDRGPYDRYGYSVIENRWAYGIAPPNERRIEKAVLAFTARC